MARGGRTLDGRAAAAQLALLNADRIALAEKAMPPWWYHVLLGLLLFVLTAGQELNDAWAQLAVLTAFFAGNYWLMWVQRRRTGMEVDGGRPGASRRAYYMWTAIGLAVFFAALVADQALDIRGALLVAGLVLGVGMALVSRWYSRRYVAGLAQGVVTAVAPRFDAVIHPPPRLQVGGLLAAVDLMDFPVVRDALGLSDSVLSEHVQQLEEASYVRVHRVPRASRLRASLALTAAGRAAFDAHVAELRRITGG